MDDLEVRQALALIKDRVKEIKQDDDWKHNIAKEWNEAAAADEGAAAYRGSNQYDNEKNDDNRSQASYKSGKSNASKMSLRSQVEKAVREEGNKRDWDPSVKSEYKMSTEDKVAARLAQEVLKDNSKLKGIHSN